MDVQVAHGQGGSVTLMTSSGLMLFDGSSAVKLVFDGRDMLAAQRPLLERSGAARRRHDHRDDDPGRLRRRGCERHVPLRRDRRRARACATASCRRRSASSTSSRQACRGRSPTARSPAVAASSPPQNGFAIDLAGLQAGNAVTLDYTANGDGAAGHPDADDGRRARHHLRSRHRRSQRHDHPRQHLGRPHRRVGLHRHQRRARRERHRSHGRLSGREHLALPRRRARRARPT